jgi:hypothetical protein
LPKSRQEGAFPRCSLATWGPQGKPRGAAIVAKRLAGRVSGGYAGDRMGDRFWMRWTGIAMAALTVGCGGEKSATEQQLSALRAEMVRMRADSAILSERLDALEHAQDGSREKEVRANEDGGRATPEPDRPNLDVVRLAPDDDKSRPVLRSTAAGLVLDDGSNAPPLNNPPTTPSRRKP